MDTGRDPAGEEAEIDIPISALEHFSYCPRQCALIHVEQTFQENVFTVRGQIAHRRVDHAADTVARGIAHVRSPELWSERYGLRGKADLVEFRPEGPYPVEYKSGPAAGGHADIQLCAQALCLEEMFGQPVAAGAVFSHADRRRHTVRFTSELRATTESVIEAVRGQIARQELPPAADDARCPTCGVGQHPLPGAGED